MPSRHFFLSNSSAYAITIQRDAVFLKVIAFSLWDYHGIAENNVYLKPSIQFLSETEGVDYRDDVMAKETKVRKKTKRKWNKTVGILLYVTAMGIVVTLAAVYQRIPQRPPKKPAIEYFSFSGGFATATPLDPNNNTIKISTVSFDMTALGGNATNVHIYVPEGLVPEAEMPYFPEPIIQGQTVSIGPIMYRYEVIKEKEEGKGWGPLNFTLTCNEAEGDFAIYVTEFLPSLGS